MVQKEVLTLKEEVARLLRIVNTKIRARNPEIPDAGIPAILEVRKLVDIG